MESKKKIIVLMSTYNGEKYLKEQIESIINQKDVNVELIVRDDGSSDKTIDILDYYSKTYSFISWYNGGNLGPAQSFLDLIKNAPDSDYYAFSDQDDVWDNDKLIIAINQLSELDSNKPNLYYSNLKIVDQNLNFYRDSHNREMYSKNKYSCLVENLCTGCTAVFNKKAKDIVKLHLPEYCTMHDTWIYMVCKIFGNCIYDKKPHICYRQHQDNVVGTGLKKYNIQAVKDKLLRIFNRKLQPRYNNAINFYKAFEEELDAKDKEKILKIINYKKSIKCRFSFLFDRELQCSAFYRVVLLKLHILWGTV